MRTPLFIQSTRAAFLSIQSNKNKREHNPWTNRKAVFPLLLWKSVRKLTFIPAFSEERDGMINHKVLLLKRSYRGRKQGYSTLILTVYRAFGTVTGTADYFRPETLLAVMDTAFAQRIVIPPAIAIKEERPFQTPLLASAHRLPCSGTSRPGRFSSGGFCWASSFFAASSRSRIEVFSWGSSRRPLLITPSIIL